MQESFADWWRKFNAGIREWVNNPRWGPGEWIVLIITIMVFSLFIVASGSPAGREVLPALPTRTPHPTFTPTLPPSPTLLVTPSPSA